MKKLLYIPLFVILLACGSSTQEAESTVGITAPDGYTVACASGHTRTLPHYCSANVATESWSVTASGCNTRTLTSVPTTAKRVKLIVQFNIFSNAAIALAQVGQTFYNDATCTTPIDFYPQYVRVNPAEVANTQVQVTTFSTEAFVVSGTSVITNHSFTNTGASTSVTYFISGYYD